MDLWGRLVLGIIGVIFCLVAAQAVFVPDTLVDPVGISLGSPSAYAELRAAYGGHFFAIAVLAGLGLRRPALRRTALGIIATVLGMFSLVRFYSLLVDGVPNAFSIGMHAVEVIGFVCALVGWWGAGSLATTTVKPD